jgi:B12 binding domain/Radical SAM superfamily
LCVSLVKLEAPGAYPCGVAVAGKGRILPASTDIILVSVPGFAHGWVPLNVARITAFLKSADVTARNLSLCVQFSDFIVRKHPHLEAIDKEIGEFGYSWHELYFSAQLFGHAPPRELIEACLTDLELNRDIYHTQLGFDSAEPTGADRPAIRRKARRILNYCGIMERFLRRQVALVARHSPAVVGFSCVDTQFLTSVFLARELKKLLPRLRTVFGGPMFQPYNAETIRDAFDEIDEVVVGEGEEALSAMLAGRRANVEQKVVVKLAAPFSADKIGRGEFQLRSFPTPDYGDVPRRAVKRFSLTTYMGKGCSHWRCSFCGISERGQQVRTADAIFEEIRDLMDRHHTNNINFGDWEINGDPERLAQLCDRLVAEGIRLDAWGEINARNTSLALFRKMRDAGIENVQVGVESFSLATLLKIKKPATVIDNVKAIKWAAEAGMGSLFFNVLCNHPGTGAAEAEENYRVMRKIAHLLKPPIKFVLNEMELYQTSALYAQAAQYDIHDVGNFAYYERCYPVRQLPTAIPMFSLKYRQHRVSAEWRRVHEFVEKIRRNPVTCSVRSAAGKTFVYDSRWAQPARHDLTAAEAGILRHIGRAVTKVDHLPTLTGVSPELCQRTLARLDTLQLVIIERGRVIGLPLDRSTAAATERAGVVHEAAA